MSLFPAGFGPRDEVAGILALVEIDAPSGLVRFMLGQDGRFTDSLGRDWWGAQVLQASALEWSRSGEAPAGQMAIAYFQDPDAPDLIADLRASGDAHLRGRSIRFYLQPIRDATDYAAPRSAPVLIATKTCGTLRFTAQGDLQRGLSLDIEGPFALRRAARGYFYTTADHAALIGAANPSLELMPQDQRQEETLFG